MKKMLSVIAFTLALNFLALAGGVGYLIKTGALDRAKALAVKELLFPKPAPEGPATRPANDPTTRPGARLDELLAKKTGLTAGQQVDFLQQTFDAQTVLLDRRRRELDDLQRQVELAKAQAARDRAVIDADRAALATERAAEEKLATDKGFQDSLALYQSMPGKQAKSVFMSLPDDTVVRYLQAMPASGAKKILKEFKSPEEVQRVQSIMEKMRQSQASAPKE